MTYDKNEIIDILLQDPERITAEDEIKIRFEIGVDYIGDTLRIPVRQSPREHERSMRQAFRELKSLGLCNTTLQQIYGHMTTAIDDAVERLMRSYLSDCPDNTEPTDLDCVHKHDPDSELGVIIQTNIPAERMGEFEYHLELELQASLDDYFDPDWDNGDEPDDSPTPVTDPSGKIPQPA